MIYSMRSIFAFSPVMFCVLYLAFLLSPSDLAANPQTNSKIIASSDTYQFRAINTESPQKTYQTFLRLKRDFELAVLEYQQDKTKKHYETAELILDQLISLLDLSLVPKASRREIGIDTVSNLLDIFSRIDLPGIGDAPGVSLDSEEQQSYLKWRIPGTPIRIIGIEKGQREGEYLFSGRTVISSERFAKGLEKEQIGSQFDINSWRVLMPQITGPMFPPGILDAIPTSMMKPWLDTPKWKVMVVVVLSFCVISLLLIIHTFLKRIKPTTRLSSLLIRLITPVTILIAANLIHPFIETQVNVSGVFSLLTVNVTILVTSLTATWLAWLAAAAAFEYGVQRLKGSQDSFDRQLTLIIGKVLGIIVSIIILSNGLKNLGFSIYSIVAGLGIGGLAVALAVRPTLENLIGGVILYLDKTIRVGDFCNFGDKTGTVESIGVRSTKLRALDRTMITVPNSALADMQLINWAKCDRMLINTTIGLRYETNSDQLRYVTVQCREMLHAHPKIHSETIRVRFTDYGASSLDIAIRIYALTNDWNEYFAIREDVFLRIKDIVEESGTGFAFPSQTLYMGNDEGLDSELSSMAIDKVKTWRKKGKLPFPRLSTKRIEELKGTLDYPPFGSTSIGPATSSIYEEPETLSQDEEDDESGKKDSLKE